MSFAGFNSLAYPGDDVMAWLKANSNLSFVGFYLAPAPSRPNSAWMGRRATLSAQGWGFSPVYVGQQEAGQPGSHVLTAAQGDTDGQNAAALMSTAGFPAGSVVYLDCEQGGPASAETLAYVGAWVDALTTLGSYLPGVYCSHTTAASLLATRPNLPVWTWKLKDLAPAPPNLPANDPTDSGVAQASVWQYAQNMTITFPGTFPGGATAKLTVDLDCASVPDPSQPTVASSALVS